MTRRPRIAVVVSTRDRADRLERLLDALRRQTLPADRFEVVIVDNGSNDRTPVVLAAAAAAGDLPLKQLRRSRGGGPAAGREAGWRATDAPLIAFTDDDCEPEPRWLDALCAAADAHPGSVVQGRVDPHSAEADAIGMFTRTLRVHRLGPWFQTANIAYPRELLERVDGFDPTFLVPAGEDTDLAWRVLETGATAVFADSARVVHAVHALPAAAQLRMALRWSDAVRVVRRHPGIRSHLYRRAFWKRSHALLLQAALGVALGQRHRPALLLVAPYLRLLAGRCREVRAPAALAAWLVLFDMVETFATLRGALRHRTFLL